MRIIDLVIFFNDNDNDDDNNKVRTVERASTGRDETIMVNFHFVQMK